MLNHISIMRPLKEYSALALFRLMFSLMLFCVFFTFEEKKNKSYVDNVTADEDIYENYICLTISLKFEK